MLEDAISLAETGFSVIWLKNRSKRPVQDEWTQLPFTTPADLEDTYIKGRNIGVRLGEHSRIDGFYLHVVDMDVRDPELAKIARKQVERLLETKISDFQVVISGSGGESRHFYFLTDRPYRSRKLWHTDEKITDADGKKHWAAEIELFGTGKQVALPPSIHPDTGKEYRWEEGTLTAEALPIIDGDVLDELTGEADDLYLATQAEPIGLTYQEAEDYLSHLDLATWCDDRYGWIKVGMALHHEFGGHKDAFKVWCDFSQQLPDRFEKKVAIEQWRSFGKWRKAPTTFATIIEASNETRYIEEWDGIADEFDGDDDVEDDVEDEDPPPYDLPTAKQISRQFRDDEDEAPAPPAVAAGPVLKVKGVPDRLLTIPGALGIAVTHYNATSTKTQPQFAVQAALALGSVILGRYWATNHDNFTSLYLVNLGETGGGKEFGRKFIHNCLAEAGLKSLIGPNRYVSEAGFLGETAWKPRHVSISDEFGRMLKATGQGSNTHMKEVQSIMMSIFGQLDGNLRPNSYSVNGKTKDQIDQQRNLVVVRPAVSMLGLSTPETFFDALSQEEVADGFLNRMIVVNSRQVMKVEKPRRWKPVPGPLREWMDHYGPVGDPEFEEAESPANPEGYEEVPFTEEAEALLVEIEGLVIDRMQHYREMRLNGLWSRAKELSQRIALIVALSRDRSNVGLIDLQWAWDYVSFYTEELCEVAIEMMGSSPVIRIADHLAEVIEAKESDGLTLYEMNRISHPFNRLMSRDKEEVIKRLADIHKIVPAKARGGRGRGRPRIRWVHERHLSSE